MASAEAKFCTNSACEAALMRLAPMSRDVENPGMVGGKNWKTAPDSAEYTLVV